MKELAVSRRNVPLLLYNVGPADPSILPKFRPRLMLICREFPETPGIRSVKSWTKGSQKIDIHLPNCVMTARQYTDTSKNMDALVEAEYERLVTELAIDQDDIVSRTLSEAVRQAKRVSNSPRKRSRYQLNLFKCLPIRNALQLSILSRLASKSFNIYGQETLGIRQEMDPECPYYRRIPLPPLLDAQLDHMLMEKMETLKRSVLSELRRMIAGQGRKHWFKIYLIMSVLLFNLESVYQNQCRQIQRYRERVSFTIPIMINLLIMSDPESETDHNVAVLGGSCPESHTTFPSGVPRQYSAQHGMEQSRSRCCRSR